MRNKQSTADWLQVIELENSSRILSSFARLCIPMYSVSLLHRRRLTCHSQGSQAVWLDWSLGSGNPSSRLRMIPSCLTFCEPTAGLCPNKHKETKVRSWSSIDRLASMGTSCHIHTLYSRKEITAPAPISYKSSKCFYRLVSDNLLNCGWSHHVRNGVRPAIGNKAA